MKTKTKGSALILTTILLFVILGMVVSLTYVTVMEQKMSGKTKSSVGSFYNAESGIEWALNKIASSSESDITGTFSSINTDGSVNCPESFGEDYCKVYLLDQDGNVIDDPTEDLSTIKAVRSVGTNQNETQRAIEAAVAGTGGGCYISRMITDTAGCPDKSSTSDSCCLSGFKNKGYVGEYGVCVAEKSGIAFGVWNWEPQNRSIPTEFIPGVAGDSGNSCFPHGNAFTCCQN